ncbi:unnamed protein product [Prunus brigantina]
MFLLLLIFKLVLFELKLSQFGKGRQGIKLEKVYAEEEAPKTITKVDDCIASNQSFEHVKVLTFNQESCSVD